MKPATIQSFYAIFGSGIAHLVLYVDGEGRTRIPCENGPTARLLNNMFPGFIVPGHFINPDVIAGKRVLFEVDELGMLAALDMEA